MKRKFAGFIEFALCDELTNESILLGGGGWLTQAEVMQEWQSLPVFQGVTSFLAVLLSADFTDQLAVKPVSAELIEQKLGLPIAFLIPFGRRGLWAPLPLMKEPVSANPMDADGKAQYH